MCEVCLAGAVPICTHIV